MKRWRLLIAVVMLAVVAVVFRARLSAAVSLVMSKFAPRKTVADRVAEYGSAARSRLRPYFEQAGVSYPPSNIVFVGIKQQRTLELYAPATNGALRFIRSWPVLAASGELGPKLREGDYQVPEGIYAIELLNPNSSYHLSLRVNYPNAFDRERASFDGRTKLGGDIMIHGQEVSVGCLAMGDPASEELFVLAADVGLPKISVILTPVDFRTGKTVPPDTKLPPWSNELYTQIKTELARVPKP